MTKCGFHLNNLAVGALKYVQIIVNNFVNGSIINHFADGRMSDATKGEIMFLYCHDREQQKYIERFIAYLVNDDHPNR